MELLEGVYLVGPGEVVDRSELTSIGNNQFEFTCTVKFKTDTNKLIRFKKSQKGQISNANSQLKNGAKDDVLNKCTPDLEWATAAVSDVQEELYLAQNEGRILV